MAKYTHYAVKIGRTPGIYTSWSECEVQVKNYPGAQFKGFHNEDDAKSYMGYHVASEVVPADNNPSVEITTDPGEMIAYVDGSYHAEFPDRFGSGLVIFTNDVPMRTLSILTIDEEMAKMRNVAGEIAAAQKAMDLAAAENIQKLTIYHDYNGIAKWCTGQWQANNAFTKAYQEHYKFHEIQGMDITFVKVKGHSGDPYNELADDLANKAYEKENENYV